MYSERLMQGFEWASRLHACHVRKGVGTAYLSHLLGVASLVIEFGGDEDAVTAALLHDAVEDCGGLPMATEIRGRFGDIVADTVLECTDSVAEDAGAKSDWEDRKRAYVASVARKSERAKLVTACDKLHNATAILWDHRAGAGTDGQTVWDRFGGKSCSQVVANYSVMLAALRGGIPDPLWRRLAETVTALEAAAETAEHGHWVARLQAAA